MILTKSGAKLLDFGLARMVAPPVVGADAPTEHQKPLTAEGAILGTFQYMAPEQLEGGEADARTDIFAFGALLYEMVTGQRAFSGKSRASLIASILDREPAPVSVLEPATPVALDRLIRACMTKEPDLRLQSAHDVATALRWLAGSSSDAIPARPKRWLWPAIAAASVIATVALALMLARNGGTPPRSFHLAVVPPAKTELHHVAISAQGHLSMLGRDEKGRTIMVRRLDEAQPRELIRASWTGSTFWSPDGEWVAWIDENRLWKIPVSGGSRELITPTGYGMGGAWREDGTIVFTPGYYNPLHVVRASGGESRPLTRLDPERKESVHCWPVVLPNGEGILYLSVTVPSERSRIFHVRPDGQDPRDILEADALVGYSAPLLLFVRNGDIYAVRFDSRTRSISGEPVRIVEKVDYRASDSTAGASVTPDGLLLYPPRTTERRRLVWYDRAGRDSEVLYEDDDIGSPSLSSDGKRLLVSKMRPTTGDHGVYRIDLERGTRAFLTPLPRFGFNPIWLPGDEHFVFTSSQPDRDYFDLFVQSDDPQAEPRLLWANDADDKHALALATDGTSLVAREYTPGRLYDLWLVPLAGGADPVPLISGTANDSWGDVSPDGKWIAYSSNVTGSDQIFIRAIDGERAQQVSATGGFVPRWSPDGRTLFFVTPDRAMMQASFDGTGNSGVPVELFRLKSGAEYRWLLGADGRFLIDEPAQEGNATDPYQLVSGWKERLLDR